MNLASNTAPRALNPAVQGGRHPLQRRVFDVALDVNDELPGISLVPSSIKLLSDRPKLDNEVSGQVFRLDLSAFLPPQPHQGDLIAAHDDPGVGTTDERAAVRLDNARFS